MKLIIEIPEEDYKGICHLKNEQLRMLPVEVAETLIRIVNGTPLDNLRAEIEFMDFDFGDYYDHTDEIIDKVCKVIDKYKAESEDKK